MTANLHAIWLDDLAPGEGSTPIWDALYAEQDAETQRIVFNACADEHTEPVGIAKVEVTAEESAATKQWAELTMAAGVESMAADGSLCGYCWQPARGLASVNGTRYCHEGDDPTCYQLATRELITHSTPELLHVIAEATTPKPKRKKPAAKTATPRKKPGVLADAEAKLAGVAARVKAQTDEMGGAS